MSGRASSTEHSSERLVPPAAGLAARRRLRRRRIVSAFCILFLLLLMAVVYGLRQSSVRISQVQIFGPPSLGSSGGASANSSLEDIARQAMRGSYLGIIPRDSIFFFPEASIRSSLLS
ncbi:MAG: hypothetical protein NTY93_01240, partial [Candidatus Kaiserbacteria bacterium]|nr:hypothetical protein [Candidatus Kaiserbacteria bacterium]